MGDDSDKAMPANGDSSSKSDAVKQEEEKKEEDVKQEEDVKKEEDGKKEEDVKKEDVKKEDVKQEEEKMATGSATDKAVLDAVAERLSFFFSDANLRCDRWMKLQLKSHKDQMIPINKILVFNSIKKHTTDASVVVEAAESELNKSTLKLNKNKTAIGRVVPFDSRTAGDNVPLSLVVHGVPTTDDKKKYAVSVLEVKEVFCAYGNVTLIRMRWNKTENKRDTAGPKGSVFVEYETEDMAKKAAEDLCTPAATPTDKVEVKEEVKKEEAVEGDGEKEASEASTPEPKVKLTLKGSTLTVVTMQQWLDKKKAEKGGKDRGSPGKKRDHEGESKGEEAKKEDEFDIKWEKKCVIALKGLPQDCDREAIRAAIEGELGWLQDVAGDEKDDGENKKSKTPYVDFSRGQTDGAIRFDAFNPKIEELAKKLGDGSVKIMDSAVESSQVLDGEEETAYWTKFIDFKRKQAKQRNSHGFGRNNHGSGRNNRGSGGRGSGGRPNKRTRR